MISLRKRFFTHTTIVVMLVMFVSLFIIDYKYLAKLEKSAQETLMLHIYSLLSVAEFTNDKLKVPTILFNPKFNTENSGLWAAVLDKKQNVVWNSLSYPYIEQGLQFKPQSGLSWFSKERINDQDYLITAYKTVWEGNRRQTFYFVVAEQANVLSDEVTAYRLALFTGFSLITVGLLLLQFIVLRLAFRPISRLEREISAMEVGSLARLSTDYPKELIGVSQNLNALVDKEHQQRERYRASMADLAHSLKTPITIIAGELRQYPDNTNLNNALQRINTSIEYQLRRAVISGHKFLSKGTPVQDILAMVIEAMEKIYFQQGIQVTTQLDDELLFYGDDNDLLEIFGNLIDNAFKHAKQQILITGQRSSSGLTLIVEDDGPGLNAQDSKRIFTRGERLDQQSFGQGIGLAVVYDIVTGYQGSINSLTSALGGAKFIILFPEVGNLSKGETC